jgi:hypothetical protein
LSPFSPYHCRGSGGIFPPDHHVFQLRSFAQQQKLRSGIIEASVLELTNGRTKFEKFATQLQNLNLIGHVFRGPLADVLQAEQLRLIYRGKQHLSATANTASQ